MTQLTQHFTLEELTHSDVASRRGIDNTPPPIVIENLKRLAQFAETVRVLFVPSPIFVHSGYRSPAVNKLVGGVPTSAHLFGLALDFVVQGRTNYAAAATIRDNASLIIFDQLILEYGWIHLGIATGSAFPRQMVLTKQSAAAPYLSGLVLA